MAEQQAQRRRSLCSLVLSLAIFCAPLAHADKKTDLQQLRARLAQLQNDLAKSEESKNEVADQLRASEKAISEINRRLFDLIHQKAEVNNNLNDIDRDIKRTRRDIAKQETLRDQLIRHQYMHGNADGLRLLVEGRDKYALERQMHYYGYISKYRINVVERQKVDMARLAELEMVALKKREEIAAIEVEQRQERGKLEKEKTERQIVLQRISTDISKSRREIGRLKRDEDRLARLVANLAKALTPKPRERIDASVLGKSVETPNDVSFAGTDFERLKGRLVLPVPGELAGRFGIPRGNGEVTWKGLFIRAPNGQGVRAVAEGRVVYADWLRGFGNLLIVDHGSGYMSLYGNNESLLKQVGETTSGGERIALVGSSGGSPESGVYFELRYKGKPFDPAKWLQR